jgi:hypothetical protein
MSKIRRGFHVFDEARHGKMRERYSCIDGV